MKRWRYNVYRVPPKSEEQAQASEPGRGHRDPSRRPATPDSGHPATLRHADSVYEDVM